ncbi:hypothetical protein [Synechococcus sp. CS-1332]|uniref:hypothetical protein n=1 Tax=Synechococcus sp. CS-1332 TaxID=2847972 RepID=UPI00223BF553|nr:hypothetical protein [Synechococcus sp. CS-1332]MCT0208990.1 hypothetical protein [Synechococcus sp. CS-1332]
MSVTTEQAGQHALTAHQRRPPLVLLLALLLGGCVEQPLPQRPITREDCLRNVTLEHLPSALQQCDKVVAAFPQDPGPLNERFLLHTLAGNTVAACRDIARATTLAAGVPKTKLDPILRQDLEVRQRSCSQDGP